MQTKESQSLFHKFTSERSLAHKVATRAADGQAYGNRQLGELQLEVRPGHGSLRIDAW
jgi:hypothetical protein